MLAAENLPNSVADIAVPFPDDWMTALRRTSPVTEVHSYLIPYWYRAGQRWVLYDALPSALIHDDELQGAPITGKELRAALENKAPRDLEPYDVCPYVSDVQHALWRKHHAYCRPFWVLQGEAGGHQVHFSPWQQNVLGAKGLPTTPPEIGSLPPCPFDMRVVTQLQHLNRLLQCDMDLDRLKKSGSAASAAAETERIQKEIRVAEMAFIEQQMAPIVEMMATVQKSAAHQREVLYTDPGSGAKAKDALQHYLDTGLYTL